MSETQQTVEPWLREILRCPQCKGILTDATGPATPELRCITCSLGYPIDSGVPVLLVDLARRLDG
ncbi:MAG TPA: Trm112 family protein [Intrasporangium sp.]|uniref:Trm112 family protein n=1 Tax=Intrasporangium sp. TaxID=1925024 RepID=UPI002D780E0E|nr:Trm112 family protein [Intrasporangium sp.]HET7398322.1 Trm112 family protein [Intrasporangium sp.]